MKNTWNRFWLLDTSEKLNKLDMPMKNFLSYVIFIYMPKIIHYKTFILSWLKLNSYDQ